MPIQFLTLYHNSYFAVCNEVQFAAASFVLGHYVKNFRDVLKIGWLPINERRDLNLLKSCFKALHNTETWPDYLKIIKQECPKELRSSNSIRLVVPTENGTFQDNASKLFNNLPETIRNCKDYRTFLRLSRIFFYITDLEYRVISQFYCDFDSVNPASIFNCILHNCK